MEVDIGPSGQVLVERSGTYELVDSRNLLTPEAVDIDNDDENEEHSSQSDKPADIATATSQDSNNKSSSNETAQMSESLPPAQKEGLLSSDNNSTTSQVHKTSPPDKVDEGVSQTDKTDTPTHESKQVADKAARPRSARRPTSQTQLNPQIATTQPVTTHPANKQNNRVEQTALSTRQTKRPMSAKTRHISTPSPLATPSIRAMSAQPARKTPHETDKEAIQKQSMADSAFEHWKRQKDRESAQKKKEKLHYETASSKVAWADQKRPDDAAFKVWLAKKTKQKAEEKEVEQIRAKIITAELVSMDYGENELAYERWLKSKNKSKQLQKKEMSRKSKENREEMKAVLHSIKTRWMLDYKKSNYLHPNAKIGALWGWDHSPLYDATL